MRVCPARKANWEYRKGVVGAGSDYCPAQDARREGARWRGASKAAGSKPEAQPKGREAGSKPFRLRLSSGNVAGRICAGGLAGPKRRGVDRTSCGASASGGTSTAPCSSSRRRSARNASGVCSGPRRTGAVVYASGGGVEKDIVETVG